MKTPSWTRAVPEKSSVVNLPNSTGGANPLRVVFYGDAHVQGFPDRRPFAEFAVEKWQAAGLPVEAVVCGLCGISAAQMVQYSDQTSLPDSMMHVGMGVRELVRAKRGSWRRADLAILMVGSAEADLGRVKEQLIADSIEELHKICLREGVQTIAVSLPDCSPVRPAPLKQQQLLSNKGRIARRRGVNQLLASWASRSTPSSSSAPAAALAVEETGEIPSLDAYLAALDSQESAAFDAEKPKMFVNAAALLPFGPTARRAGLWAKDGLHFSIAGARTFGDRLADVLRPLLARMQADLVAQLVEVDDASTTPSLEAYMAAFQLEDEGTAAAPQLTGQYFSWHEEAARRIQRHVRGGKEVHTNTAVSTAAAPAALKSNPAPPKPAAQVAGAFDGKWFKDGEYQATITGTKLTPDEETIVDIEPTAADAFKCELMGDILTARLVDGRLVWNDGDTWEREAA